MKDNLSKKIRKYLRTASGAGRRSRPRGFVRCRRGATAILFGLLLPVLLVSVGVAVDYSRAHSARADMQADLDSALIAAVKKITTSSTSAIKTQIETWFAAQTMLSSYSFDSVAVDASNGKITATVSATVSTVLLKLIGVSSMKVAATSQAVGPSTSYINVYIVLDNSASMMLAATAADQKTMYAGVSCVFACHSGSVTVGKVKYASYYAYARALGITLRTDLELDAAEAVLSAIKTVDADRTYIKAGVYRIGQTATQVLAPTLNLTTVSAYLTEATAESYSYFDKSLPALATLVGTAGDGSSSTSPLKLVLLLTDGVQSSLTWISSSSSTSYKYITPLNPDWCDDLKTKGATVGALYTTYTTSSYITSDSHYSGTLAQTMASSYWASYWGGSYDSGVSSSTARVSYLPTALGDCASSSSLYLSASEPEDIESGLAKLFRTYMSSVRLTE